MLQVLRSKDFQSFISYLSGVTFLLRQCLGVLKFCVDQGGLEHKELCLSLAFTMPFKNNFIALKNHTPLDMEKNVTCTQEKIVRAYKLT